MVHCLEMKSRMRIKNIGPYGFVQCIDVKMLKPGDLIIAANGSMQLEKVGTNEHRWVNKTEMGTIVAVNGKDNIIVMFDELYRIIEGWVWLSNEQHSQPTEQR